MDSGKRYGLSKPTELSESVSYPLRNNKRIKFTCFDCSMKYLVFGANSGSLYLFDRLTMEFLAIIPSQLGAIGQVSISKNEKQIAMGNQSGSVGVVLELDPPNIKEVLVTELCEGSGKNAYVTTFCWGEEDRELYCGDSAGIVSLIQFSLFMGRNILNITLHPVLLLENQVVQIDKYKDLLLVSTLSKCVLCNTAREEFKQIGNRPRDGQYGASFVIASSGILHSPLTIVDEEDVRIFCSRPGCRLWEADLEGNVIRTHQFKHRPKATEIMKEVAPFKVLHSIRRQLLLVHDSGQLLIIDPLQSNIVLRTTEFSNINQVAVVDEWVYVLTDESRLFQVQVEIEGDELSTSETQQSTVEGKENGVYILDNLYNNNGGNTGKESSVAATIATEVTIKEALVSVVRGKYGRNIKQMFLGYEQLGPERPKTLDLKKVYAPSTNGYSNGDLMATDETGDDLEEVVPNHRKAIMCGKKMFSASLLSDYETSEDDASVRNLYLIYRSSIISNLSFADRYAKIFDDYDTETIIRMLRKLETVMEENEEHEPKLKCIRIYFDYLKPELMWEIDPESRRFIKSSFIEFNQIEWELSQLERCDGCGYYLRANPTCHYREIGVNLMQYYWSRQEYSECFALVRAVPYLWRTVTRYYIQDRRQDKIVQCVWNLADRYLFEKAVNETFGPTQWQQLFDLVLSYERGEMLCLNCDKKCSSKPDNSNRCNNNPTPSNECSSGDPFRGWNYLLNVAIERLEPKALLGLLRSYVDRIPKGAISTSFYVKCLLQQSDH